MQYVKYHNETTLYNKYILMKKLKQKIIKNNKCWNK
jgi:hypothetical protein